MTPPDRPTTPAAATTTAANSTAANSTAANSTAAPLLTFDPALLQRYDAPGPRYTSYPTAPHFHAGFGAPEYEQAAKAASVESPPRALSLYVHIPFCRTICYYCACNKIATNNRARAEPYLARLFTEIGRQGALFAGREAVQLHWGGGTPTFLSPEQMGRLMAALRQHFRFADGPESEHSIEIDPREADADTATVLRALGFNRMSMGLQDFDPKVQEAVNRIQTEEETARLIHTARAEGFQSVSVDLIYGLPRQTVAGFSKTLDRVIALAPDRLSVFNYAHLPERFKTQKQIDPAELPGPTEKLEILAEAIGKLQAAGYRYIGMDHFAKPDDSMAQAQDAGTLHRNFQGYSTHAGCDLVAMGVSAIGKVGPCYAQNTHDMEDYLRRIDAGGLAVFRGLRADADDLLRRQVINGLICHFRLAYDEIETAHGIRFADYFAPELADLAPLVADGLVRLTATGIEVLPPGRLLIRNLCTVFDRYLRAASGTGAEQPRYSRMI
jgi:oxygen-independent coproporphyrinogen-3 oxidase